MSISFLAWTTDLGFAASIRLILHATYRRETRFCAKYIFISTKLEREIPWPSHPVQQVDYKSENPSQPPYHLLPHPTPPPHPLSAHSDVQDAFLPHVEV